MKKTCQRCKAKILEQHMAEDSQDWWCANCGLHDPSGKETATLVVAEELPLRLLLELFSCCMSIFLTFCDYVGILVSV